MSEPSTLVGRVAVVTGAGSGIGAALATTFARHGAKVVVSDVNAETAENTAAAIQAAGGVAIAAEGDVTNRAHMERVAAVAESTFGYVSVLAANAGYTGPAASLESTSDDEFRRVFDINVGGVWTTCTAMLPSLRRAGGGSVIVTGSIMADRPRPGFGTYSTSKAAVNHLARVMALEWAPFNIRVNCLAPTATETNMLPTFLGDDDPEATRSRFLSTIPLGRLARPEDVSEAALFLASESASFLTGVVLPVDGGRSI